MFSWGLPGEIQGYRSTTLVRFLVHISHILGHLWTSLSNSSHSLLPLPSFQGFSVVFHSLLLLKFPLMPYYAGNLVVPFWVWPWPFFLLGGAVPYLQGSEGWVRTLDNISCVWPWWFSPKCSTNGCVFLPPRISFICSLSRWWVDIDDSPLYLNVVPASQQGQNSIAYPMLCILV